MSLITSVFSHPGGRSHNEDFCDFAEVDPHFCWALADGLGGQGGGEVASEIAVSAVIGAFESDPELSALALSRYLQAAQNGVIERQTTPSLSRMSSTIVVLLSDARRALWGHAGDSRLYHFRDGRVGFQTRDHSVAQAFVESGQISLSELRFHEDRNQLRQSLGMTKALNPEVLTAPLDLKPDDAFLLCSDGFWENVLEIEMEIELAKAADPGEWIEGMVRRLKERVSGDHDNYSAIGVFVEQDRTSRT